MTNAEKAEEARRIIAILALMPCTWAPSGRTCREDHPPNRGPEGQGDGWIDCLPCRAREVVRSD